MVEENGKTGFFLTLVNSTTIHYTIREKTKTKLWVILDATLFHSPHIYYQKVIITNLKIHLELNKFLRVHRYFPSPRPSVLDSWLIPLLLILPPTPPPIKSTRVIRLKCNSGHVRHFCAPNPQWVCSLRITPSCSPWSSRLRLLLLLPFHTVPSPATQLYHTGSSRSSEIPSLPPASGPLDVSFPAWKAPPPDSCKDRCPYFTSLHSDITFAAGSAVGMRSTFASTSLPGSFERSALITTQHCFTHT